MNIKIKLWLTEGSDANYQLLTFFFSLINLKCVWQKGGQDKSFPDLLHSFMLQTIKNKKEKIDELLGLNKSKNKAS